MGTTVSGPVLRRLSTSDVSDVSLIEAANQPRPWSEQIIRDELGNEDRIYLALLDGDMFLGFGGVMVLGDDAHVTNLLVAPDMRRRGFARRILIGLIDSSLERGAKNLTLEVRSKNVPAISLYRRFGLSPVGLRPGYYGDDDALIMWVYDIDQEPYSNRLDGMR